MKVREWHFSGFFLYLWQSIKQDSGLSGYTRLMSGFSESARDPSFLTFFRQISFAFS